MDFSEWFISLNGEHYDSLAQAQAAGASTLNFGTFLTVVINFLLMALVIFFLVKGMNTLSNKLRKPVEEAPTTKTCPYCKSEVPLEATRCPHCTSELPEEAAE